MRPRTAALAAGLCYLLTPTPFADFYVYPHLVIPGKIEQTAQNILAHQSLFAAGILAYLLSFVFDVIIAWALYYLLKPVSASLSLLAAWFQLVYTSVGLCASLNLVPVLRLQTRRRMLRSLEPVPCTHRSGCCWRLFVPTGD